MKTNRLAPGGTGKNTAWLGARNPEVAKKYAKTYNTGGPGTVQKAWKMKQDALPTEERPGLTWTGKAAEFDGYRVQEGTRSETTTSGTSIFDPVLTELAYKWFCPPQGTILDPFAGGSVRGIVAGYLGYQYTGIDLSAEQIAANEEQARRILVPQKAPNTADVAARTPIEYVDELWLKRDDTFTVAGVQGGKARTCYALAQGAKGLVTAGSRASPQVNIVARIAQALGIPCRVHTPSGALAPEVQAAAEAGAYVIQHAPGYNSVIIARAQADATEHGYTYIPFGMECAEAITQTRTQVQDIPPEVQRLVVPVGSGMSLAGILWGLKDISRSLPVIGVVVGADPTKRLDRFAPPDWRSQVTLQASGSDYHAPAAVTVFNDITLDAHYEAKCIPFLQPHDLFWLVGIRQTATLPVQPHPRWIVGNSRDVQTLAPGAYDFIFSCPPYGDLEVYGDNPEDLSTMKHDDFLAAYRAIIAASVAMLKPNRFACFVVGDFRDKAGFYRNFVSQTIDAFQAAGMTLYNEGILVTVVGSLPIRIGRQFGAYRKLGKTHQNIIVCYNGDVKAIPQEFGEIAVADLATFAEAPSDS